MRVKVLKRWLPWVVVAAVVGLSAACGQRGDLYLPSDEPAADSADEVKEDSKEADESGS